MAGASRPPVDPFDATLPPHPWPDPTPPPPGLSKMTAGGVNPPGAGHDEAGLIEAARTDRRAFGVLYDRHFDAIYHYIARRVGDADTAEDIASHVWERALKAIERYEVRGVPFAAWLYRIAGNLVANHHRRARLLRMVPLLPQHAAAPRHETVDEHTALRSALTRLSISDQEILCLCYDADLSPAEIAEVLDCTPAAVHKRLHRARTRLRQHLEGLHATAPSA